jgi:phage tail-like protein
MMKDPFPGYRFVVTLDRADAYLPPSQAALLPKIAPGEFRSAKGLGAELEVLAYPEGGMNGFVHQLPVRHSWSRIVLERGVVSGPQLWEWYRVGLTKSLGARRDGSVTLMTPEGKRAIAWDFRGGIAVKWTGPELNAMESAVAIESLEIAHHGLRLAGGVLDIGEIAKGIAELFS